MDYIKQIKTSLNKISNLGFFKISIKKNLDEELEAAEALKSVIVDGGENVDLPVHKHKK